MGRTVTTLSPAQLAEVETLAAVYRGQDVPRPADEVARSR